MGKTYIKIDDARMAETYTVETEIPIEGLLRERDVIFERLKKIDELIILARTLEIKAVETVETTAEKVAKAEPLEPRPIAIAGDGIGID